MEQGWPNLKGIDRVYVLLVSQRLSGEGQEFAKGSLYTRAKLKALQSP